VAELWVPGYAGPLDNLVERIHRRIEHFAQEAAVEQACVEVELADSSRYCVETLSAEPGYGFVTLRLHPADDVPDEVIVPVGSIKRIELSKAAEERGRLGFSLPAA
jgi:hypothetical protein